MRNIKEENTMKRTVVLELVRRIIIRNPLKLIFILSFSTFALLLRPYFDLISLLKMSLLLAMLLICAIIILTFIVVCVVVCMRTLLDDWKKEIKEIEDQQKDQF